MTFARRVAAAACAALLLAPVAPANAEPGPAHPEAGKPYPGQAEVQRAEKRVKELRATLDRIGEAQASAHRRADDAWTAAEVASERFNRAAWQAKLARKSARKAVREARVMRQQVEGQRVGIATMVAQNFQDGTALNGLTTIMGVVDGPSALMERYGVAQSAGLAMKATYDGYALLSSRAEAAELRAKAANRLAERLSRESLSLRAVAAHTTRGADAARGQTAALMARYQGKYAEAEKEWRELRKEREQALEALADEDPENDPGKQRPLPKAPKPDPEPKIHHGIADSTVDVIPRSYPGPVSDPPAADPKAAKVVIDFAREQLGDMYLWAAVGPNRWDCSGLTMGALAQVGIALPHYSEAQYLTSTPISAADLAPGDLVFWQGRQERIHHVALYIGNGEILHAKRTGEPVQIEKIEDFTPPDYFARP